MNQTSKKMRPMPAVFLLSIGAYLISILFRPIPLLAFLKLVNIEASFLLSGILLYIFAYFITKHYRGKLSYGWILAAMLAAPLIFELPLRAFNFRSGLITFPDSSIKICALLLGWVCARISNRVGKIVLTSAFYLFAAWGAIYGYQLWGYWVNFRTTNGNVNQSAPAVVFSNDKGEAVELSSYHGKYVLLDFWFTRCGYCYEFMPRIQSFYDRYTDDPRIVIRSVHCSDPKQEEDFTTGKRILEKRKYTFPCLSLSWQDPVLVKLGVTSFPTFIIVDPEGRMVFRGRIDGAEKYIEKALGSPQTN